MHFSNWPQQLASCLEYQLRFIGEGEFSTENDFLRETNIYEIYFRSQVLHLVLLTFVLVALVDRLSCTPEPRRNMLY